MPNRNYTTVCILSPCNKVICSLSFYKHCTIISAPCIVADLTYKLNIKQRTFQLTLSLSNMTRPKILPHSKEITFQEDQIPYYSPMFFMCMEVGEAKF